MHHRSGFRYSESTKITSPITRGDITPLSTILHKYKFIFSVRNVIAAKGVRTRMFLIDYLFTCVLFCPVALRFQSLSCAKAH